MSLHDATRKIKIYFGLEEKGNSEIIEFNEEEEVAERFPLFQKLFLSVMIILVASLSFGIGRLSIAGNREPVRIEYDASMTNTQTSTSNQAQNPDAQIQRAAAGQAAAVVNTIQSSTSVVVSKNGSKYHYSHCSGAKQIKAENKIVFATPEAAEAAGYTLAANCSPR